MEATFRRASLVALPLLVGLFGAVVPAQAQFGGCVPSGPAGRLVCETPELARIADELAGAFREVLRSSRRSERPELLRNQRDWTFGLDSCLGGGPREEIDCLNGAYEDRIAELGDWLTGNVGAGPVTGAAQQPVEGRRLPPLDQNLDPDYGADRSPAQARVRRPLGEGQEADGEAGAGPDEDSDEVAAAGADGEADDEEIGAERGPATARLLTDGQSGDSDIPSDAGALLTGTVWRAEVTAGVRPGTIYVFHDDGALVTADCVEAYRIGTWQLDADATVVLNEGERQSARAKIVSLDKRFARLEIAGTGGGAARTLILRPAVAPFACKG